MTFKTAQKLRDALLWAGVIIAILGYSNVVMLIIGILFAFSGLMITRLFNKCPHCGKQLGTTKAGEHCRFCGKRID